MSATAKGSIKSTSSTKFIATFIIEGVLHHFTGNLPVSVQDWSSANVDLTYTSVEELTSSRSFIAGIGKESVQLLFNHKFNAFGLLDMPISHPAPAVAGTGTWSQNLTNLVAQGSIKSTGDKFISTFVINEIPYHFTGNLSVAVQNWSSANAILTYTSVAQLTGTRPFSGQIGVTTVDFKFDNGPTIIGQLDTPIDPPSTVSGTGTWSQSLTTLVAQGSIRRMVLFKFFSTFVIDGIPYHFTGNLSGAAAQNWNSVANAMLTYTSVAQLMDTRSFSAHIGLTTVDLKFDNGPMIVGSLDVPINPPVTFSETGTWSLTPTSIVAKGFIESTSGDEFTSTFMMKGIPYHFTGNFSVAVQKWSSANALLTCSSVDQLTGTRVFQGTIGPTTLNFEIGNGPKITGPLDSPINPPATVSGSAVWSED